MIEKQEQRKNFILGLVTGVAIIVVLGGVYMLGARSGVGGGSMLGDNKGSGSAPTAPAEPQRPVTADASKIAEVTNDEHIRGDQNAAITMIEYSDFECPFCARFHPTIQQVMEQYQGRVRLVYRHFPLRSIHTQAQKAAEASECAADQGKFWEMHDKLFELNQSGTLALSTIKSAAGDIGLDTTTFNSCLDSGEKAPDVEADYQDGLAGGVTGTPGTFVNDQYIAGALPFAQVQAVIESLL